MREILSARADGEVPATLPAPVREHIDGCAECEGFEGGLARLSAVTGPARSMLVPDLAPRVAARMQRRRDSRIYVLRWAVGLMGGAELANAALELILHGTAEAHATHESLSFSIAVSLALVLASLRPDIAAAYLPVVGTAVALLGLTATFDVSRGRVAAVDELPHVDLLVGWLMMWVLAREVGNGPGKPLPWMHVRAPRFRVRPTLVRPSGLARLARIGAGTAIVGAITLVPSAASAHAILESSTPAPNSVLTTAPTRIELHFSESITAPPGALTVYGPAGDRVDAGDVKSDDSSLTVDLSDAAATTTAGTYLVSWRVVSADSHPVSGAFTYSVGHTSAAPSAPEQANDDSLRIVLGASRFLGYAAAAALVGGIIWWLLGGPATALGRRVVLAGAGLSAVTGLIDLLVKAPFDAGLGWGSVGNWALLQEVLSTTYGRATLTRIVLALLLGVLVLVRARMGAREFALGTVTLSVLLAVSLAMAGHAAAAEPRWLAILSWTVHAGAMCVWIGGLIQVLLLRAWRTEAGRTALLRFSALALACVAALVATGLFQAWRQVGSWAALAGTPYGKVLSVKVGLVVLVVAVAYVSRHRLRGSGGDRGEGLGRTVLLEAGGLLAVLAVTSALVAIQPAATAYHPSVAQNLTLEGDLVQVSAVPDGERQMELHLYVFDADNQPVDPAEITASVDLPAQRIGALPITLTPAGAGHRIGQISVPVVGDWRLSVTLRTDDFNEETGTVAVPVR